MKKNVKYGIVIDDELVRCSRRSNEGQVFCGEETVTLCNYGDEEWLVDEVEYVEKLMEPDRVNPGWYNADYETPISEVDLSKAKPVKVYLEIEEI